MIHKVTNTNDIEITAQLAHKIWNDHYVPIIGQNQVDYMLAKFQSFNAISNQLENGYEYFLISENNKPIGYLGLISNSESKKMMISKIYINQNERGAGYGKQLIDFTIKLAKEKGMETIWLTVNKNNSNSIKWYQKLNFKIKNEVEMDIGNGFIMDDFVMELQIN
ncbi:GNAT family N-acetyltransferase [Lutibacter flavus]|uniref:Ribosomal protein S18 acetylase RimI n=1 Tax=Lutibacter flavus TaxID=691689 RepID=A0A238VT98_9FLAO|nr:GNAT family N-acetyltransferase [Lutibacter flavus]SNR36729.1 Ribosomal protein S18 acetylase RimI [Lutibacter flavus]